MDWTPIWLSIKLSLVTTVILVVIGLPLAYWLSLKSTLPRMVIEVFVTMPLVLPPSVLGFYLLLALSPQNALGRWLQHTFNVSLVFSFGGLLLASVIYSLPFMINPVKSAFHQLPRSIAEASYTMGKTRMQAVLHILIPNIKSAIITAAVLTFAHTLGEFGVVLMIGGNIPGVTRVASIAIYDAVERMEYSSANYYSLILFAITFVIVLSVYVLNRRYVKSPLE